MMIVSTELLQVASRIITTGLPRTEPTVDLALPRGVEMHLMKRSSSETSIYYSEAYLLVAAGSCSAELE